MPSAGRDREPALITDAQFSLHDEQRVRKRVYTILMIVHLVGFTLAGLLAHVWWLAIALIGVTGPLPWVAVVIANDRLSNRKRQQKPHPPRRTLEQ